MTIDWASLTLFISSRYTAAVRAFRTEHPDQDVYGVAAHDFYGEMGEVIAWPLIAVASEEGLDALTDGTGFARSALRWSPADWQFQVDPDAEAEAWAARVAAAAGDGSHWEATYARYLRAFAEAAGTARGQLVADGTVGGDFIVVAMDEAWELVPLSVTKAQLERHFPELEEEARERERLANLPVAERAAELAAIVDAVTPSAIGTEEAMQLLRGLGEAAVDVAVQRVSSSRKRWVWAKLLADAGIDRADAVEALMSVMRSVEQSEPDRCWAAAALARLDHMDAVVAEASRLPRSVLKRGLAAPYTSFRDDAAVHPPLDYAPLEAALDAHPGLDAVMLEELQPGSGYCTIDASEVETAMAALDSPFEVVRRHARHVLEYAPLQPGQRERLARVTGFG